MGGPRAMLIASLVVAVDCGRVGYDVSDAAHGRDGGSSFDAHIAADADPDARHTHPIDAPDLDAVPTDAGAPGFDEECWTGGLCTWSCPGADCRYRCREGSVCDATCGTGVTCRLDCDLGATCTLTCGSEPALTCSGDCRLECP